MDYSNLNESFNPINPEYQPRPPQPTEIGPAPDGYQTTGDEIPVAVDDLTLFMKDQLRRYDQLERDGRIMANTPSPYSDPWIYELPNGKQIQIPSQIQRMSISEWLEDKKILDQYRHDHQKPTVSTPPVRQPSKPVNDNWIENKLIWLLIGLVLMYILIKHKFILV